MIVPIGLVVGISGQCGEEILGGLCLRGKLARRQAKRPADVFVRTGCACPRRSPALD